VPGQGQYTWDGEKWTSGTVNTVGAVRYDTAQNLTEAQDAQARSNIYAAPFDALAYNGMQINGSMEVSQENGIGAVTVLNTNKHVNDGWFVNSSGVQNLVCKQEPGAPAGLLNSLSVTPVGTANPSPAATDFAVITQRIEGWRAARLAWGTASAKPITIGFWVNASRSGLFSGSATNPPAFDRGYIFTFTITTPLVWEYKTVTIPGDTTGTWKKDNTAGVQLNFTLMAGSNQQAAAGAWAGAFKFGATGTTNGVAAITDVFYLTGVVVLPGIEAPSAERSPLIMRPYDQELLTCKRYFHKINFASSEYIANLQAFSAIQTSGRLFDFPVEMRTAPAATASGNANFSIQAPAGNFVCNALGTAVSTVGTWATNISVPTGLTAGQSVVFFANSASAWLQYSARL
jgi:hypothetical protein